MIASQPDAMNTPQHPIQVGAVTATRMLCREHHRLTIRVPMLPSATPGQFVHLSPFEPAWSGYSTIDDPWSVPHERWSAELSAPLLRRAFSIAGRAETRDGVEVEVIFRVVGAATRWMERLRVGDSISVLGPLGNGFPIHTVKPIAWLVAGGVGLPPMLWLAEALNRAGKRSVAFCGAQSADLLALTLDPSLPPARDARTATLSAREFAESNVAVVISTDDGSAGFRGHVGSALTAFADTHPTPPDDVVVYTCGPERMMRFVAEFCIVRSIECHVCVERNMACGTGMCQSCVVPVRDSATPAGWRYRLCCTEGPVFDARQVLWESPQTR
ncbi:MAG: dihydroorotate dehydrogenase electron transfer subunit [Phycisphaerales bacterium]|nr:dihydroorotate dehydrogenase electron transfer subunit [Phycisphaerales bacterium]